MLPFRRNVGARGKSTLDCSAQKNDLSIYLHICIESYLLKKKLKIISGEIEFASYHRYSHFDKCNYNYLKYIGIKNFEIITNGLSIHQIIR